MKNLLCIFFICIISCSVFADFYIQCFNCNEYYEDQTCRCIFTDETYYSDDFIFIYDIDEIHIVSNKQTCPFCNYNGIIHNIKQLKEIKIIHCEKCNSAYSRLRKCPNCSIY